MSLFNSRTKNLWRNNVLLLVSILVLFFIEPARSDKKESDFVLYIFLTILIYSSIFSLNYRRQTVRILFILGIAASLTLWTDLLFATTFLRPVFFIFLAFFLVFVTGSMVLHIAKSSRVNTDVILSSINGYLLLGIVGAMLIMCIILINPGIEVLSIGTDATSFDCIYFSFVTLSTLGYGDIYPVLNSARSVSILLGISGQLYLTIIIAMLVGKYISSKPEGKELH